MSTVIKASGPIRAIDGGSFNFDDMADRANQYLETVRQQAQDILTKAEQDAKVVRNLAEEQGRAAALKAAEKILEDKVGRQLSTLLPALHDAIQGIHSSQAQWLSHWEQSAVHVAAAIAGRLVRRELSASPSISLTWIREALELAAGSGDIQLRLHPDDVEALGPHAQRLAGELARLGSAQIVPDATITRGGCRIDTRFGSVDQQIEAQLARIEQELT